MALLKDLLVDPKGPGCVERDPDALLAGEAGYGGRGEVAGGEGQLFRSSILFHLS